MQKKKKISSLTDYDFHLLGKFDHFPKIEGLAIIL
jgi:hypothetical protein